MLTGHARGVFQGRIEVDRVAQKTDGYQMSQALLLSPDAEIDCKPELQIYADDVKCSHGATIGELNADQLFYLRARGIPEAEARSMLVRAFLDDALEAVTHEAGRAMLEQAVEGWWQRRRDGTPPTDTTMQPAPAFDVERIRADFPILQQTRARQAAGVPGQRRLRA